MKNKNKKGIDNEKAINRNRNRNFEEQVFFDFVHKIEIPTNPLSFYFNSKQIEKYLSESVKKYFYKAIDYFVSHEIDYENSNTSANSDDSNSDWVKEDIRKRYGYTDFLFRLYYYSGVAKYIALWLDKFLNELKFYYPELFLDLAWNLGNLRAKIEYIYNFRKKRKNFNNIILALRKKSFSKWGITNLQSYSSKKEELFSK